MRNNWPKALALAALAAVAGPVLAKTREAAHVERVSDLSKSKTEAQTEEGVEKTYDAAVQRLDEGFSGAAEEQARLLGGKNEEDQLAEINKVFSRYVEPDNTKMLEYQKAVQELAGLDARRRIIDNEATKEDRLERLTTDPYFLEQVKDFATDVDEFFKKYPADDVKYIFLRYMLGKQMEKILNEEGKEKRSESEKLH